MTTAFVFAGGGSLGAVEVGMLEALVEHGERPDLIAGASAGAINGAYFAADPSSAGVGRLKAIWCGLTRADVFPFGWHSLVALFCRRDYLVPSDGLRRLLERHLPYPRLERASVPVHIVATELVTGDEVVLSQGSAVDAVLASTAIPGVFPSVVVDGRMLVDGGVCNNTPISAAVALGADRVVVLPTGYACGLKAVPPTAIGKALHSLGLLVARQLVRDIERFRDRTRLHVVPPLCPVTISPYDYGSGAVLIERALASTRAWIARGGLAVPAADPSGLAEHRHAA